MISFCQPKIIMNRITFKSRRQGITSVIAMFYLAVFSMLSIGFYSTVTTQVQLSYNDMNINAAQAAAESGMQFVRYQLSVLNIPPGTAPALWFNTVYTQLAASMNGTTNFGSDTVGLSGTTINLPATAGNWINLDGTGARFIATIVPNPTFPSPTDLIVKVTGQARSGQIMRAVQMTYYTSPMSSSVFGYGIATKGWIAMTGNSKIQGASNAAQGSVLAATMDPVTALSMNGNQSISGGAYFVNPNAVTSFTGNSTIGGYAPSSPSFSSQLHMGITSPAFPSVDTSGFLPYCTNTWTASTGTTNVTLVNTILPSGTYTFSGNCAIQGILYIKTPAKVTFAGNTNIQGCIVVENNPQGTPTTDTMTFVGNTTATAINTLPANATFPAGERALTNSFLLAPNFSVSFSGNFGTVGGSMIADNFTFTGNAGGTVNGSIVGLGDKAMSFTGNANIVINSSGAGTIPSGAVFNSKYVARSNSYQEVLP